MAPKPTLSLDAIAQAVAATPGGMGIEALQDVFPQVPGPNFSGCPASRSENRRAQGLTSSHKSAARLRLSHLNKRPPPDITPTDPTLPYTDSLQFQLLPKGPPTCLNRPTNGGDPSIRPGGDLGPEAAAFPGRIRPGCGAAAGGQGNGGPAGCFPAVARRNLQRWLAKLV